MSGKAAIQKCASTEKLFTWSNVLLAVVMALFLLSFAVVFTLNFRSLYYFDIGHLDIPAASGLEETEIRENYDTLISYNSLFFRGPLRFPTLPMSRTGEIHFEEVKQIFDGVQVLMFVSLAGVVAGCIVKLKQRKVQFLKLGFIFSVAVPAVLGALIALSWEMFFILFHGIFFRNNYWVFDPATDPVITILPDGFFLHCAVMILVVVLLGSAGAYLAYRLLKRRFGKKREADTGKLEKG